MRLTCNEDIGSSILSEGTKFVVSSVVIGLSELLGRTTTDVAVPSTQRAPYFLRRVL